MTEHRIRAFIPGRLCLFGEHSDWAGTWRTQAPELRPGHCLVMGTDQGLSAVAEPLDGTFEMRSVVPTGDTAANPELKLTVATEQAALDEVVAERDFFSLAAGVVAELVERKGPLGLRLQVVDQDLPVGRGLSSSSATSVLVVRAYNLVHELGLSVGEEMELAHAGERRAGFACGRMDHVGAMGRRLSYLVFDGQQARIEPWRCASDIYLLVADLRRINDTRRIFADLQACFPDAPGALAEGVREALGPRNEDIVSRAGQALEAGAARALGELMTEAQEIFDHLVRPASPALTAPRVHQVLQHRAAWEFAFGGKGVGSQGDACAQFVTRGEEERDELARCLEAEFGARCLPLTLRAGG